MKRDAAAILKDALALPTEARADLAGSLLESLDSEVDEDPEAAWATEINRRIAELDGGEVKTVPRGRSAPPTPSAIRPRRVTFCRGEPLGLRVRSKCCCGRQSLVRQPAGVSIFDPYPGF